MPYDSASASSPQFAHGRPAKNTHDILPRAPNRRVGNAVYALSPKPSMLALYAVYFGKHFVGCPLNTLIGSFGAAVQLQYSVYHSVVADGIPGAGKRFVISPVKRAVYVPVFGNFKRFYNVRKSAV